MNQLAPVIGTRGPALSPRPTLRASYRFLEFFTAQIRNASALAELQAHDVQ